jgi:signal peptidase II
MDRNSIISKTSGVLFFVAIDQLSKYIIRFKSGFYICNYDIAFGIGLNRILFIVIWALIVSVLGYLLFDQSFQKNRATKLSLSLILAGAVSNMADRIGYSCVIDFIDLHIWPSFNIADVFITVGAIIMLILILEEKTD